MRSPYGAIPEWGIFTQDGQPVLLGDAVHGIEYQNDYRISDAPQEKGSFQSYNKVKVPWQAKVRFLVSGTVQAKNAFLAAAEAACASLDQYVVATPEFSYISANLIHLGYDRSAQSGAQLMRVEIWCEEVRIVAGTQLSNTKSPNGAAPTNNGPVQPTETTPPPSGNPGGPLPIAGGSGTVPAGGSNLVAPPPATQIPPANTNLFMSQEFQTPVTVNPLNDPVRTVGDRSEAYNVLLNSPPNSTVNFYDGTTLHQMSSVPPPETRSLFMIGPPQ
jgi:hypothetical protein